MATMNISVPDLMRDFVQRRIDSGRYASVSDYVRDLIRKDQGALLERDLDAAVASAESGIGHSAEQVFEWMDDWAAGNKKPLPLPDVMPKA
jgi:antitoxin ParD1/3/4